LRQRLNKVEMPQLPARKLLFWAHLVTAVAAGMVIFTMAVTGLLLSFEAQVQGFADRRALTGGGSASGRSPAADAPAVEPALARLAGERPELGVSAVTVRRDAGQPILLAIGRTDRLFLDAARGEVLGAGAVGTRRFFRAVTDLHRYLAASGDRREAGKAVTGGANLAFLFVLLSGLYLWVPRLAVRLQLRNALWFRGAATSKGRDFNWHHVFGIWALLPLVVVVASAVPISYRWAGELVLRVGGEAPRPAGATNGARGSGPSAGAGEAAPALAELDLTGIDRALAVAAAEQPRWRSILVRLPADPDGALAVTVDASARRGRPDLRTSLVVDRATGGVAKRELFGAQSAGRRARSWMRWLHTGEAGGLLGQLLAAFACVAVLVLGWTGYALAWRRWRAWRRRLPHDASPFLEPAAGVDEAPEALG
jgi:uncharacterized iron-regulated membrane protein